MNDMNCDDTRLVGGHSQCVLYHHHGLIPRPYLPIPNRLMTVTPLLLPVPETLKLQTGPLSRRVGPRTCVHCHAVPTLLMPERPLESKPATPCGQLSRR